MWIRKKIRLLNDRQLTPDNVLTRETIAEHQQALNIVQQAERQAQARLDAASQQVDLLLAESRQRIEAEMASQLAQQQQAFLTRADALFTDWEQQQQQWQSSLLPRAEALLVQAMKQVLAEQPSPSRIQAMLQQLLKAQGRQATATLICAPSLQQMVEAWLAQHPQLGWRIASDAGLEADSLQLTTEKGELHLSWAQLCEALVSAH